MARNAAAVQRRTISALRQRVTRRVRIRTPDCGLSIKLVVAGQRCSDGGTPSRLIVKLAYIRGPEGIIVALAEQLG